MSRKKVIAIDFDGTLCRECYPRIGAPRWSVLWWARRMRRKGHFVILWTCREGQMQQDALLWCIEHGFCPSAVNKNDPERTEKYGNDCRKIGADYYLDDKAQRFIRLLP